MESFWDLSSAWRSSSCGVPLSSRPWDPPGGGGVGTGQAPSSARARDPEDAPPARAACLSGRAAGAVEGPGGVGGAGEGAGEGAGAATGRGAAAGAVECTGGGAGVEAGAGALAGPLSGALAGAFAGAFAGALAGAVARNAPCTDAGASMPRVIPVRLSSLGSDVARAPGVFGAGLPLLSVALTGLQGREGPSWPRLPEPRAWRACPAPAAGAGPPNPATGSDGKGARRCSPCAAATSPSRRATSTWHWARTRRD